MYTDVINSEKKLVKCFIHNNNFNFFAKFYATRASFNTLYGKIRSHTNLWSLETNKCTFIKYF